MLRMMNVLLLPAHVDAAIPLIEVVALFGAVGNASLEGRKLGGAV